MTTRAEILHVARGRSLGAGPSALAVDVGGTGMKAALFDTAGSLVDARTEPTPSCTQDAANEVIEAIGRFQEEFAGLYGHDSMAEAAVVVPGIVDDETGTGLFSANLGWRDVPFRELLSRRLGMRVALSHDVRAAGRAEFELGRDTPANAVMITIGTGLAGAIRIEGDLLSAGGYAGEIGFTEVAVDTGDGRFRGPIEHIASAAAIARRYSQRSGREAAGSLDVVDALRRGDAIAAEVFGEAVDALGAVCAQLVAIIAPDVIVFGGGLSSADELLNGIEDALRRRLNFHKMPIIRRAVLGPVAGLIGAGLLTRRQR
ncbi:ROK family protein [Brevibacterium sp.]|uniref:ROK family protein n=1 Tax=Brevibacterium sp. TaxID=1701 RepID=UPI0028124909|nr:ROK family protein [Brevibacterium sp.]